LIAALGLSQLAAAEFLGISPRQSRRWALGETVPDVRAKIVLRLMVRYNIDVDEVNHMLKLKLKDLKK
jgi:transcriptional regulator with XRE-family HTH domain